MELLAYRSLYLSISSNQHFVKSIGALAKIGSVHYPQEMTPIMPKDKDKKMKCMFCADKYGPQNIKSYDQVLMLILHIEIIHPDCVQAYEIGSDSVFIRTLQIKPQNHPPKYIQIIPGKQDEHNVQTRSYFLQYKHSFRMKQITSNILSKLQKLLVKKDHIYYHSTDIFRKIQDESEEEDSEEELGEIERELEKLRIEDFADVNENDKNFFIEWNSFIHDSRKRLSIIFKNDIPKLFISFAKIAKEKKIPRINFVMHSWTLWSVGSISDNDIIKALEQYDSHQQQKQQN